MNTHYGLVRNSPMHPVSKSFRLDEGGDLGFLGGMRKIFFPLFNHKIFYYSYLGMIRDAHISKKVFHKNDIVLTG